MFSFKIYCGRITTYRKQFFKKKYCARTSGSPWGKWIDSNANLIQKFWQLNNLKFNQEQIQQKATIKQKYIKFINSMRHVKPWQVRRELLRRPDTRQKKTRTNCSKKAGERRWEQSGAVLTTRSRWESYAISKKAGKQRQKKKTNSREEEDRQNKTGRQILRIMALMHWIGLLISLWGEFPSVLFKHFKKCVNIRTLHSAKQLFQLFFFFMQPVLFL